MSLRQAMILRTTPALMSTALRCPCTNGSMQRAPRLRPTGRRLRNPCWRRRSLAAPQVRPPRISAPPPRTRRRRRSAVRRPPLRAPPIAISPRRLPSRINRWLLSRLRPRPKRGGLPRPPRRRPQEWRRRLRPASRQSYSTVPSSAPWPLQTPLWRPLSRALLRPRRRRSPRQSNRSAPRRPGLLPTACAGPPAYALRARAAGARGRRTRHQWCRRHPPGCDRSTFLSSRRRGPMARRLGRRPPQLLSPRAGRSWGGRPRRPSRSSRGPPRPVRWAQHVQMQSLPPPLAVSLPTLSRATPWRSTPGATSMTMARQPKVQTPVGTALGCTPPALGCTPPALGCTPP